MLRAYKYRIYPNKSQQVLLAKTFGCVRFLWNKNVEAFRNKTTCKTSTELRKKFEFFKEVSAAAIQQKEKDFKQYKTQYFSKTRKKKLGKPQFKTRRNRQSYRLPNQKFKINDNTIQLEKIGKIRIIIDREFSGRTKSVTISRDLCGYYFASVLVDEEIVQKPKTNCSVGIDVGLSKLITTSDGLQVDRIRDNQMDIKRIQRRFSRKVKGSVRYHKLRLRLAKLHRKVARRREWLLHNVSKHLVNSYDVIVTEDLNVSGMMKNQKLAGAIADASWSELIRQLEYKCEFYGKKLFKVGRFFLSSKICHSCGFIKKDLTLAERVYVCDSCGFIKDRDVNAALNIQSVGVPMAKQTVMGCKTYSGQLEQAIPNDLLSFL